MLNQVRHLVVFQQYLLELDPLVHWDQLSSGGTTGTGSSDTPGTTPSGGTTGSTKGLSPLDIVLKLDFYLNFPLNSTDATATLPEEIREILLKFLSYLKKCS
ncbi:hypothetical protein CDAR_443541 [Caerostris darwini]|uniref:Uncharacterized protein n=1 Tax=Caerostris darwini TaxID=1538125 RepID=A0AAV4WN80_9ARAC|nr:hypothetical protein CDAR_443541 [Caerostris darwini]